MNLRDQVNRLEHMATAELVAEYESLFGKKPRTRSPVWMRKRIAYRLQENAYGGLSGAARAEIEKLASEVELPARPVQGPTGGDTAKGKKGLPKPGTTLERMWRNQLIRVTVLEDGVEWEGTRYRSLSAVARAITGAKWNGRLFFGLTGRARP